jgi:beta-glucanase (GH16 family)
MVLHIGGSSSANHASAGGNYTLPSGDYYNGFHVFSIEWSADKIEWFVDSTKYYELSMQQVTGSNFPFDKDFFLIFNVAVGGDWPGNPDASSVFPQKMYVDYVRVYQR